MAFIIVIIIIIIIMKAEVYSCKVTGHYKKKYIDQSVVRKRWLKNFI